MRRLIVTLCILSATVLAGGLTAAAAPAPQPAPAPQAERNLLTPGLGYYPRVIRLEHNGPARANRIISAVTSQDERGRFAPVSESTDEGKSFHRISEIRDPEGGPGGMCCGTLFELPQQVGDMKKGTLLWAASYGQDAGPEHRVGIKVWKSEDAGRSWNYLATPARSHNRDGIWEPEFNVDAAGKLWLHFADETEAPQFAQTLNRVSSDDGVNWGPKVRTMAIPPDRVRPGMPIIRRLPDGRYYFSYEVCNHGKQFCGNHYKISNDGASWGDPGDPGPDISTKEGNHLQHAHTIALFPGGPSGTRVITTGQIYVDPAGKPLPRNGEVLLANDNLGAGPWYEVPAPVHVKNPDDNWCPNYSSAVLPVDNGANLLHLAADHSANTCQTFFGRGPSR